MDAAISDITANDFDSVENFCIINSISCRKINKKDETCFYIRIKQELEKLIYLLAYFIMADSFK